MLKLLDTLLLILKLLDRDGEGMWLFDPKIANLRKMYSFAVKIEIHRDRDVAGRRVGKVLPVDIPQQHPILSTLPVNVPVEYTNAEGRKVMELMPAYNLRVGQVKSKARLAIIKGNRTGEVVIHARTDGPDCRVYYEGNRSRDAFRIPKSDVCVIECVSIQLNSR